MSDPYRLACPPPPEPVIITYGESSMYMIERADILFKCKGCGNEWRLRDTFELPRDTTAFQYLQIAWSHRHHGCNK